MDEPATKGHSETAVFAGGCFWGVQTVFQQVKGVTATTAGYSGGTGGDGELCRCELGEDWACGVGEGGV